MRERPPRNRTPLVQSGLSGRSLPGSFLAGRPNGFDDHQVVVRRRANHQVGALGLLSVSTVRHSTATRVRNVASRQTSVAMARRKGRRRHAGNPTGARQPRLVFALAARPAPGKTRASRGPTSAVSMDLCSSTYVGKRSRCSRVPVSPANKHNSVRTRNSCRAWAS